AGPGPPRPEGAGRPHRGPLGGARGGSGLPRVLPPRHGRRERRPRLLVDGHRGGPRGRFRPRGLTGAGGLAFDSAPPPTIASGLRDAPCALRPGRPGRRRPRPLSEAPEARGARPPHAAAPLHAAGPRPALVPVRARNRPPR